MSREPAGRLGGRVAVVTGGTSGIGRTVAERLAAAGAQVLVVARTATAVQQVAGEIGSAGVAADVATREGVDTVVAAVGELGGAADIVVHAAGAFALAPLIETSVESFDRMIGANLRAAFLLVRAFAPGMLQRGSGDIVLIGSIAGRQAFPSNGAYSASKFGLRGMHAVLAAELRGSGVRATLIEPAATDTPLWEPIDRDSNPGLPAAAAMLPADAVADAVLYAASRAHDVAIPNILVERA